MRRNYIRQETREEGDWGRGSCIVWEQSPKLSHHFFFSLPGYSSLFRDNVWRVSSGWSNDSMLMVRPHQAERQRPCQALEGGTGHAHTSLSFALTFAVAVMWEGDCCQHDQCYWAPEIASEGIRISFSQASHNDPLQRYMLIRKPNITSSDIQWR